MSFNGEISYTIDSITGNPEETVYDAGFALRYWHSRKADERENIRHHAAIELEQGLHLVEAMMRFAPDKTLVLKIGKAGIKGETVSEFTAQPGEEFVLTEAPTGQRPEGKPPTITGIILEGGIVLRPEVFAGAVAEGELVLQS